MADEFKPKRRVDFPVDYTCHICGDEAAHDFLTEEARETFNLYWFRLHPDSPHESYARTASLREKRRDRIKARLP